MSAHVGVKSEATYQNIIIQIVYRIIKIEPNEMLCKAAIQRLVDLVKDEVEKVEPRYQSRWQVNVARYR